MNPEKLRGSYGKMLYMLQDAITPGVREHLEFSAMRPVKTVYELLERKDALRVLQDPHVCTATAEILPAGKSRAQIRRKLSSRRTPSATCRKSILPTRFLLTTSSFASTRFATTTTF